MSTLYTKQGDRRPDPQATLAWPDTTAIDLSTAGSVTFKMRPTGTTSGVISHAGTIATAASGIVGFAWQAGDTATVGTYDQEWEIGWGAGTVQTVPNYGWNTVIISDDLD